jgi:hypothetical protein
VIFCVFLKAAILRLSDCRLGMRSHENRPQRRSKSLPACRVHPPYAPVVGSPAASWDDSFDRPQG